MKNELDYARTAKKQWSMTTKVLVALAFVAFFLGWASPVFLLAIPILVGASMWTESQESKADEAVHAMSDHPRPLSRDEEVAARDAMYGYDRAAEEAKSKGVDGCPQCEAKKLRIQAESAPSEPQPAETEFTRMMDQAREDFYATQ